MCFLCGLPACLPPSLPPSLPFLHSHLGSANDILEASVIIGERNKAAMQELQAAIRAGYRRIAIFYGSAHLPDFDKRLQQDMQFRPVSMQWRTAWSICQPIRPAGRKTMRATTKAVPLSGARSLIDADRWKKLRYRLGAYLLLSAIVAADLCMWEVLLKEARDVGLQLFLAIGHLLDQGWGL